MNSENLNKFIKNIEHKLYNQKVLVYYENDPIVNQYYSKNTIKFFCDMLKQNIKTEFVFCDNADECDKILEQFSFFFIVQPSSLSNEYYNILDRIRFVNRYRFKIYGETIYFVNINCFFDNKLNALIERIKVSYVYNEDKLYLEYANREDYDSYRNNLIKENIHIKLH